MLEFIKEIGIGDKAYSFAASRRNALIELTELESVLDILTFCYGRHSISSSGDGRRRPSVVRRFDLRGRGRES
jgi:hypothetical protein